MAKALGLSQQRLRAAQDSGHGRRGLAWSLPLSAALSALLAFPVRAAKWDIVPTISVGELYTDNLSLAPDALRKSAWVTQVSPGISIAGTGAELRFNASYAPQLNYYSQGAGGNNVRQQLKAFGNAELAKQFLFIDASAGIGQQNISVLGPLTSNNINTTGNLATVRTFLVSPYLVKSFGSDALAGARFTHSVWESNSSSTSQLSNSMADRVNLRLASGPAYKLLTWDLAYFKETIDYEREQDSNSEVILASARRLITSTLGLTAQLGYEDYESGAVGRTSGGSRWSAGMDWTPSPRTSLAATAGERYFGSAYSFDFRHRTRLTTWSAGYSEDVTNTRSEAFVPSTTSTAGYLDPLFLSGTPDPAARQRAVERFIGQTGLPQNLGAPVNFFSGQQFLAKRWKASAGIMGVRNVLIANVHMETREALSGNVIPLSTGDFAASRTVEQSGTDLAWNWRLTPQDTWNLGLGFTRNKFPTLNRVDNLKNVRMSLTRQFQPRVSGSLSYRRSQRDSSAVTSDYTENVMSASVAMRF